MEKRGEGGLGKGGGVGEGLATEAFFETGKALPGLLGKTGVEDAFEIKVTAVFLAGEKNGFPGV